MPALLLVALLCAAGTPAHACTRATALDVIARPCASAIPTTCLAEGQTLLAAGALGATRGLSTRLLTERRRS